MEKLKIIPPDAQIYAQVKASWDKIAKPLDGLGQFETMFAQIGAITGNSSLSIEKKVILTMCADNGIVAEGVSQSGQEVTAVVAGFMGQQASSVGKMARRAGVDVIPVDIGINTKETLPGVRDCKVMQGTRDFLQEPAMTEEEALQALSVGIDLVRECKDKGYQLIGTGEMGIGNTTTSSMLVAALTGRTAEEVTGRGAGLNDAGLLRKQQVIAQALEKYERDPVRACTFHAGGIRRSGYRGNGRCMHRRSVVSCAGRSGWADLIGRGTGGGADRAGCAGICSAEPSEQGTRGKMDRGGTETSSGHRCRTGAWGRHRGRDAVFPSGSGTGTLRGSDNI